MKTTRRRVKAYNRSFLTSRRGGDRNSLALENAVNAAIEALLVGQSGTQADEKAEQRTTKTPGKGREE